MSTSDHQCAMLYVRVSTPGQAEKGYSLRERAERLRAHCAEHGLEVLEVVKDASVSGAAYATVPASRGSGSASPRVESRLCWRSSETGPRASPRSSTSSKRSLPGTGRSSAR
jgi:hypothetical protein